MTEYEPPAIWVVADDITTARVADDPETKRVTINHAIDYLPDGHPAEAQLRDAADVVNDAEAIDELLQKALVLVDAELPDLRPVLDVDLPRDHYEVAKAKADGDRERLLQCLLDHINMDCRYYVDGDLAASTVGEDRDKDGVIIGP